MKTSTSTGTFLPASPSPALTAAHDAEHRGERAEAHGDRSSEFGDRTEVARIGKIARLPRVVREELNERLAEGEDGGALLAWLNGDERVVKVLAEKFGGRAISKQNLSAWRGGGYAAWCSQQQALEATRVLVESLAEFEELDVEGLAERMSAMAAVALGQRLTRAMAVADADPAARKEVLEVVRELIRLRTSDRRAEKARREEVEARRKLAVENEKRKEAEIAKVEAMQQEIQRKYDIARANLELLEKQRKPVPKGMRAWLAGEEKEMRGWANSVERVRTTDAWLFDPLSEEMEGDETTEEEDQDEGKTTEGVNHETH